MVVRICYIALDEGVFDWRIRDLPEPSSDIRV